MEFFAVMGEGEENVARTERVVQYVLYMQYAELTTHFKVYYYYLNYGNSHLYESSQDRFE